VRRKTGSICIVFGAAFILAALCLFVWNWNENRKAGEAITEILPQVTDEIERAMQNAADIPDPYGPEMTETQIDGYSYIGKLSVPALNLELPVMADWSYPKLKVAPCRYYGSTKTDDLVIAAHNYSYHFGMIKNLSPGDAVYFTDMDGVVSGYEVAEIDTLSPASVEEMTDSGFDLTLFTCTYGGQSRVTVRCERESRTWTEK